MTKIISIREAASTKETRKAFSHDIALEVDQCVTNIGGIKGAVIKKAYAVIKNVRPNYIEHMIFVMSEDLIEAYSPLHDDYRKLQENASNYTPFEKYLEEHKDQAYEALISVTDKYAESRKGHLVGKTYSAFRSQIKSYFHLAIPCMGRVTDKYTIST